MTPDPNPGADEALRRERELLQAIFDAIPVMLTLYEPDTRVLRVNPEFERVTGWGADPALLEHCYPDPAAREEARQFMQDCAPVWKDFRMRTRAGGDVEASWTNIRLSDGRQVGIGLDVSERRRADAALRESEARFRDLYENANDILYTLDLEGRLTSINKRAAALGYTEAELLGRSVATFVPPEYHARMQDALRRKLTGEASPTTYELETVCKDGRRVVLEVSSRLLLGDGQPVGIQGIARDATERRRAERALRDSERMLAQSQRAAHVGSWELDLHDIDDLDANPLRWSDETYRLFGYEPGSVPVTNELFFRAVHPDDRAAVSAAVAAALKEDRPYEVEHRILRPDGSCRVIQEWASIERDPDGRPMRMLGTCQDVTERRAAEAALREADRKKDEFLAMLGHELRNPLAPIRNGLVVLGQRAGDDPATRRVLAMMERQVAHAVRLIDDLLDVSRVRRGRIELRRERVALADVVARALEEARAGLEERRHRVEVVVAPEPLALDADPVRLQQIVTNLLTNAAKYTPPGGRVALWAGREAERAVVRVRDNGIGIRPEMLGRIFELFTQADRVEGRVSEGLGLGLPLVKTLAELHGGAVEAHSDGPGRGSEFVVRLPLLSPWSLVPGPSQGTRDEGPGTRDRGRGTRRVLVVDDNQDAAESIALLLRLKGHEVQVVYDGAEALRIFDAFAPQVVLLDIGMPGMTGYEVARRIRAVPGSRGVLVVAMTGYGQDEDRRRAREAGFDHHLVKPVDLDVLLELLVSPPARRQGVGTR
jgi:PAS domain S-box-containing protein